MHRHRRRGPRPLLVLQWVIVMLIVFTIMRSFGLPWFFWVFPFFFVWGGCWDNKPHRKHRHHRKHDDYDDEDDDTDYV